MNFKSTSLVLCLSALCACGGGTSPDEMTMDMDDDTDPPAFADLGYNPQLTQYDDMISEAALLAQAGTNSVPSTSIAEYAGIARLTEASTVPGAALPTLLFAATGEISIVANIENGTLSGVAGNFFESSDVFHSSGVTTGTAMAGTLTIDANGASGTLTKSSGEVATYTLTTDAGFVYVGPDGDFISAAAAGTSAATGRADVDALGDFIASK